MIVREAVPISSLTTFRIGGPARYVIEIEHAATLPGAIAWAHEHTLPYIVLGEGSNVLASDQGYEGVVFRMRIPGVVFEEHDDEFVYVHAGAGVSWDALVTESVTRGLWGIENLAGIPGTVGAAPVQNIGAYGVEVESTLVSVTAFDTRTGETYVIPHDACEFGYRESRFKHEPHFVITQITLRLSKQGMPQVTYGDLTKLIETGELLTTSADVADAVRKIRSRKFPDLRVYGTAGSFFKNPIITEAAYEELTKRFEEVIAAHGPLPRYPFQSTGKVKVPLAYILDKVLGLRDYRIGHAHLFERQPLVLVVDEGGTASDVQRLAEDVTKKVFDATNILIEREVRDIK